MNPFDYAWAILKQDEIEKPNIDWDGQSQPVSQQSSDFPNQGTLDAWGVPSTTMLGPQPNPNPPDPDPDPVTKPWWARPYDSKKPDWRTGVGLAGLAAKKIGRTMGLNTSAQRQAAESNMIEPHWGDE